MRVCVSLENTRKGEKEKREGDRGRRGIGVTRGCVILSWPRLLVPNERRRASCKLASQDKSGCEPPLSSSWWHTALPLTPGLLFRGGNAGSCALARSPSDAFPLLQGGGNVTAMEPRYCRGKCFFGFMLWVRRMRCSRVLRHISLPFVGYFSWFRRRWKCWNDGISVSHLARRNLGPST